MKDKMRILLIEDSDFDAFVTNHYLKKGGLNCKLDIAHNGMDAFDLLEKSSMPHARLPDLILVDIGLPDMDGREIITRLNQDQRFGRIPTMILTGDQLDEDPVDRFNLYDYAYVNKWVNMIDFLSFIKAIDDARQPLESQHKSHLSQSIENHRIISILNLWP